MQLALGNKVSMKVTPAPLALATRQAPDFLKSLIADVEENWEAPEPAQYDHAFQQYMEALLMPLEQMENSIEDQRLQLRSLLQRMIEIAPDFFDKALRRSAWETGYLIEKETDHA